MLKAVHSTHTRPRGSNEPKMGSLEPPGSNPLYSGSNPRDRTTGSNSLRARGVSWYVADAGSAGCRESYRGVGSNLVVLLS